MLPDDAVDEQLDRLPRQALLGYADVLAALEIAPSGGRPYNDAIAEGPMRCWSRSWVAVTFLAVKGSGVLTFDAADEVVCETTPPGGQTGQ